MFVCVWEEGLGLRIVGPRCPFRSMPPLYLLQQTSARTQVPRTVPAAQVLGRLEPEGPLVKGADPQQHPQAPHVAEDDAAEVRGLCVGLGD